MDEVIGKKNKKKKALSKGVETMYRNAYRAQLDMISLAATKANIMISINGFIVSILLVSGSVIYRNDPGFIIPGIIFLLTSAFSIYFALSSATPEAPTKRKKIVACVIDLLKGKFALKDFNAYRHIPAESFDRENSNILVFEDYARVSKEVYLDCMNELINDPQKIYDKMSDQLYQLGKVADKKFTQLRYSYTSFRWGLLTAIGVFIIIKAAHFWFPHTSVAPSEIVVDTRIQSFDKIFEPSGVVYLPDNRMIVIEDEASQAFHVIDIKPDGSFVENKDLTQTLMKAFPTKLNDLEAITIGPDGYVYAITSHQRNSGGERNPNREQLVRFKIESDKVIGAASYGLLQGAIDESGILGKVDEQGNGGIVNINIEALSFNSDGHLMLGFRSPLSGDKSIIGILENPNDVLESQAKPIISEKALLLDLYGAGIRAMTYDSNMGGYLITNEVYGVGNGGKSFSQLLFWDGNPTHRVYRMYRPGLENIEGISSISYGDKKRIILISDNGKETINREANYLLLSYKDFSGN